MLQHLVTLVEAGEVFEVCQFRTIDYIFQVFFVHLNKQDSNLDCWSIGQALEEDEQLDRPNSQTCMESTL